MDVFSAIASLAIQPPTPTDIDADERTALLKAAFEVRRCQQALDKAGLNVVGELLRGHDGFFEMNHYPDDDVYDRDSHAQYYYHAHREDSGEHGHFHTFLRASGMPDGFKTLSPGQHALAESSEGDAATHLVAVSMNAWGQPIGLFACNRWVTGETWYPDATVRKLLESFTIDHAYPSWATNLWLTALLRLFRPHITALVTHRDQVVAAWQQAHPERDALEDRSLEITGYLPVSIDAWVAALEQSSTRHDLQT